MKKFLLANFLPYVLLSNALSQPSKPQEQAHKNGKPNFIIILADDMGYGDIGCFGNTRTKTPNLDQMAKEGVKFVDFHSNGAVCSPTRAALLTGKYQQRTGITGVITAKEHRDVGLSLEENTLAEALKKEGYATGIFGKWHLGYAEEYNPTHQGFDEYIGYVSGNVDYQSHIDQEGNVDWWKDNKPKKENGYSTDLISNHAIDFIKRHKEQPFLLYIAHEAPHYPYQDRGSKADRFPGAKNNVDFPTHGSEKDYPSVYKSMIEILDESVGETMKALKTLGLYNNTVVVFCSDNGAPQTAGSNGALKGHKATLWEGGHRVPAMVQWPGHIKPGWTSQETVLTMDVFPTLLSLAGSEENTGVDGVDISSNLLFGKSLPSRTVFWQCHDSYAVRKGEWKLACTVKGGKTELYNLNSDLEEKNDVAASHPKIVDELASEYKAWIVKVSKGVKKKS